tara:strand:+ start:1049 stop:1429 length:381 start_codon:yes stop_codon:yes gene_type:complete
MHKVFVYGTLKKGGSNHYFLKGSMFLRETILKDHSIYAPSMYGFPLLLEDKGGKVHGEVYKVNDITLRSLDMLESEGYLYNRIDNKELGYQYYLYNYNKHSRIDKKKDKIKDGIWSVRNETIKRNF